MPEAVAASSISYMGTRRPIGQAYRPVDKTASGHWCPTWHSGRRTRVWPMRDICLGTRGHSVRGIGAGLSAAGRQTCHSVKTCHSVTRYLRRPASGRDWSRYPAALPQARTRPCRLPERELLSPHAATAVPADGERAAAPGRCRRAAGEPETIWAYSLAIGRGGHGRWVGRRRGRGVNISSRVRRLIRQLRPNFVAGNSPDRSFRQTVATETLRIAAASAGVR